jgi:aspartyl-tRNA(Asn)/glutamyl-tRNA(Gln) amidotransferase subunit A
MQDSLHYLTVEEAATALRARRFSARQLVEAHLARIEALDPTLHAFITVTAETALDQARIADADLDRGVDRGPLHGIPIAHKDIIQTAGVRTTAHSKLLQHWIPDRSATVYEKLHAAGAISLGKTALHEFAFGSPGEDEAFPAARYPWNVDHMPGSSSSGSGAAVAAGLCMAATGTDTGGSVRHPAAVCGVVGMKPTFGRVSNFGVLPLAPTMDHVGPITRTVVDNAIVLQALAGHDPADPSSAGQAPGNFRSLIGQSLQGMRVGVPRRFIDSIEHTDEILKAFAEAEAVFRRLDCLMVDVDPEGLAESHDAGSLVITYEAYQYHRRNLEQHPDAFSVNFRGRFAKAPGITAADYEAAKARMATLRSSLARLFESKVDVVINPARERPPQKMAELWADPLGKRSRALRMYSAAGNPAAVLPMGFTRDSLPLGIQVAGPHWREDRLYQAAHAYEQAAGWYRRHPIP